MSQERQVGAQGSTGTAADPGGDLSRLRPLLLAAKPWIRYFSVLGFIGCGLLVIVGFCFGVLGVVSEALRASGPLLGLVYLGLAVVYLFPALYLHRCANALRDLAGNRRVEFAEAALSQQYKFWRFSGIVSIVMLFLYPIIVFFIFVAMMTTASGW